MAGKKSKPLWALNVALDELPETITTKAKQPARKITIPPPPDPGTEWNPNAEDYDNFITTGEQRDSRYEEKLAEYQAAKEWAERFNAGLPHSPEPPQGKYYTFPNHSHPKTQVKASAPAPPKPESILDEETGLPEEDDDFDPADDCDQDCDEYD